MGIELTSEQLREARQYPVRITDPETGQVYVLLTAELHARVLGYDDSDFDPREAYPHFEKVMAEEDAGAPHAEGQPPERKPA